ncbi:type II/IV secretion system protein [Bacillus salacetis]|uniref:Type II/IV secretion system protein n=1 Tax=Bacillus salacetis TaxID=2315464 RepID=A0A3A1QX83_9BACI|nr:competence type IV pilus ATPase ComGA [Bacillus salacetis]RIW31071.1 type II/IV secretion system protein [Bacillus salacetis]
MVQLIYYSIEALADSILKKAVTKHVTDIHLFPRKDDYLMQHRSKGILTPNVSIPIPEGERLISHFKFMASMDIGEKRKPQSGSFTLSVSSKPLDLRVSTLPTTNLKESLVIRILPQQKNLPIEKLALYPASARKLLALLMNSHGLIIFTGPTGSGKTTTLYSLVEHCSSILQRNVVTLEDPVEKFNDSLVQVQVNEKAGVTYSAGLRAILRHDPDIIMVGEIRDEETAAVAIRAALTGHLVLSTLHTKDAKGAVYRLMELGIQWHEIQQSLIAVSAQRLINLVCPYCGETCMDTCIRDPEEKRATIYEILHGKALEQVLKEAKGELADYQYPTLTDLLKKGYALGYIPTKELQRWKLE